MFPVCIMYVRRVKINYLASYLYVRTPSRANKEMSSENSVATTIYVYDIYNSSAQRRQKRNTYNGARCLAAKFKIN